MEIDLEELAKRENERVEWKEKGGDREIVKKIVKTLSAFANDIANVGGGYVVCGAKEGKDEYGFPKVIYSGLTASQLQEIRGKVTQHCRDYVNPAISPTVVEVDNPEDSSTRILVFIAIASPDAHVYRDGEKSSHYVRIASDTREARNGILTQLLVKKQKIEYFDKRANADADESDVDILIFREYLQEMGIFSPRKTLEEYFSEKEQFAEFIPPLFKKIGLDHSLRPRNFTLLLFGKKSSISRLFPEAYTVLSVYRGKDRSESTAERHLLTGTLVEQAKKAIELLNAEAYVAFDKLNDKPNQVKYPRRALQEAVINAIVHRDYEITEPNRITVFNDRIEIRSPGALHWAVDQQKFKEGKASPKWRNQSFAYLFNKMQLAQSEGQGIPTIIRTMREEGCPDPVFELGTESVTCVLPAHPRHQMIREIQEIQDKIILENYQDAQQQVLGVLAADPYNFRALDLFVEIATKLRIPTVLYEFLIQQKIDLYAINSSSLLNIVDALSLGKSNEDMEAFAARALDAAISGRLEEGQIVKATIGIERISKPEAVVKFVSEALIKFPKLARNPILLKKRATSKMELAKICRNTASNQHSSSKTTERAWQMYRMLLEESETDLNQALSNVESLPEKSAIEEELGLLQKMRAFPKEAKRE